MKKTLTICSILAIFILTPCAIADPTVVIESYELSPSIFMPGDSGILTLTIYNAEKSNTITETTVSGSTTTIYTDTVGAYINEIWIDSASDSSGKKVKSTNSYDDIGGLSPTSQIKTDFKIIAEENISEGNYFIIVRVDVETYKDVRQPIKIIVSNETVNLLSTNVPSKISKSGSTLITLTAVNNRENPVNSVTVIPQTENGIEFTPNSVYIGSLDAYASSDASFSVKPSEIGVKDLSFQVRFKNGNNVHFENLTIPIEIIETLDVAPVFIDVPTSIEKGKTSRVNLEVYNAKTETISGVIVTPITEVKVTPSQYFIGSMGAGDVFSATFEISSGNLDYGNYSIGFKVGFKQENDYYETSAISSTVSVVSESEGSGNLSPIFPFGLIIFIIIIIIVLFFFYKKRRKNRWTKT